MTEILNQGISERGLKSAYELGCKKEHGTRLRYMAGCHCFYCRRANSDYERERIRARANGDWNGLVPAKKARAHMRKLSRLGVGRRAVGAATDVADSVLVKINNGERIQIRARTERLILAVSIAHASDGAYVDARTTWKQIRQLLREGFTKIRIAEAIGQQRALQLGRLRVTARHAGAIDRLWRRYMTPAGV
ncbi:hypothetical protein LCGC14_3138630 [marine sediment metagenome]|uniref:Uncharacterized protein n=1 Tax=marine sediment metagenome TaxID=412755 RepID=A0A0F8VXH4_9ZZZZ